MTKRKILIASFFVALMLTVPFTSIAKEDVKENGGKESKEDEISSYEIIDVSSTLFDTISTVAEFDLQYLALEIFEYLQDLGLQEVQSGEIEVSSEELSSVVQNVFNSEQIGLLGQVEPIETEDDEIFTAKIGDGNLWRWILEKLLNLPGNILEIIAAADIPRFGYINGIADFYVLQGELMSQINYNLSPNVTWVEVIEETAAKLGYDVDVHDFVFITLQNKLIDLAENRTFIFEGLGIRKDIYETYILPVLLSLMPGFVQNIYDNLMEKVEWERGPLNKLKDSFGDFLKVIVKNRGKDRRRGVFANFTKLIGSVMRLGVAAIGYAVYMNETQWNEYFQGINNSIEDYKMAWNDFFIWINDSPWNDPVLIDGNVTSEDNNRNVKVYCNKDPDTCVFTDVKGDFYDLKFKTYNEPMPFALHNCVTTAENDDFSMTLGGLDEETIEAWIINRIFVGSFSGGNITCEFNFDEEINDLLFQFENTEYSNE